MFNKMAQIVLVGVMCIAMSVTALANEALDRVSVLRFEIGSHVYYADGLVREIESGAMPFVDPDSGNLMLPLRTVAEALGFVVTWVEETRTVTAVKDGVMLLIPIDETLPGDMGTPISSGGRVFVPLAYVTYGFGAPANWDGEAREFYIYGGHQVSIMPVEGYVAPVVEAATYTGENLLSAYELLNRANEVLVASGSMLAVSESSITVRMDDLSFDTYLTGVVTGIFGSNETDIDMRVETTVVVEDVDVTSVAYLRNGVLYMELLGEWIAVEVPAYVVLAQYGLIGFSEQAVISQTVTEFAEGTEIVLVISGYEAKRVVNSMLDYYMLDLLGTDIVIGNINVTAMLNTDDGALSSIGVIFNIYAEVDGVELDVYINIWTDIVQIGGMVIDFPQELDNVR